MIDNCGISMSVFCIPIPFFARPLKFPVDSREYTCYSDQTDRNKLYDSRKISAPRAYKNVRYVRNSNCPRLSFFLTSHHNTASSLFTSPYNVMDRPHRFHPYRRYEDGHLPFSSVDAMVRYVSHEM